MKMPTVQAKHAALPTISKISTSTTTRTVLGAHTVTPILTPTPTVVIHTVTHSSPTVSAPSTPTNQTVSFSTPTSTPIPSPTHPATLTPTTVPIQQATTPSSDTQSYIMNGINDYRASKGLSSVKTDSNTCNFAKTRAQEITTNFNHDGFSNRLNNHTLPYANYSQITENIAMTSDYKQVVPMWIASPGHAENMQKDTPFVCVEQSGNYFAYEGWKP